jgi:hypothetical protein
MPANQKCSGAVILCERIGRIASLVRSKLPSSVPLVETRTTDQCQELLGDLPASLLIVEATAPTLERCLRLLGLVADQFPEAASIVIAHRDLAPIEPLLREAGAAYARPMSLSASARFSPSSVSRSGMPSASSSPAPWPRKFGIDCPGQPISRSALGPSLVTINASLRHPAAHPLKEHHQDDG